MLQSLKHCSLSSLMGQNMNTIICNKARIISHEIIFLIYRHQLEQLEVTLCYTVN